jgi:hypothetical protein
MARTDSSRTRTIIRVENVIAKSVVEYQALMIDEHYGGFTAMKPKRQTSSFLVDAQIDDEAWSCIVSFDAYRSHTTNCIEQHGCIRSSPRERPPMNKTGNLEGGWAVGDKCRAALRYTVGQRELELGHQELLDVGATNIVGLLDLNHTENVDGAETSTVPSSHVLVQALHGIGTGEVPVLLVHVVGTRTGVVAKPDTKVLDLERLLFVNDIDTNDFTGSLLDLLQLPQEVPVPRLGDDLVRSKNSHPINFGVWVILGGKMATDDLVFLETHFERGDVVS